MGLHAGATGDLTLDLTLSSNPCIGKLEGGAVTVGGSIATPTLGPHVSIGGEVNLPSTNSDPSYTISPGIGVGTPVEGHSYFTYTVVSKPWIQIGGVGK
jgi:hypothetical protein